MSKSKLKNEIGNDAIFTDKLAIRLKTELLQQYIRLQSAVNYDLGLQMDADFWLRFQEPLKNAKELRALQFYYESLCNLEWIVRLKSEDKNGE